MQRRGGGLNTPTAAISAVVTTSEEETMADVSTHHHEEQKDGCNTNDNNSTDNEDDDEENENKMIMIHSYNSTTILMGLGMQKSQFATWVQYYLSTSSNEDLLSSSSAAAPTSTAEKTAAALAVVAPKVEEIMSKITTQQVHWENDWEEHITTLRQFWNEGKLLVEHTSLLNDRGGMIGIKKRKKKKKNEEMMGQDDKKVKEEVDDEEEERQIKYDHFKSILGSHADRLVHIVEDELSDESFIPTQDTTSSEEVTNVSESSLTPKWNTRLGMRGWIETEYGMEKTRALMAEELLVKSEKEQLEV